MNFRLKGKEVNMRRERTEAGYALHITGPGADYVLVGEALENVEFLLTTR